MAVSLTVTGYAGRRRWGCTVLWMLASLLANLPVFGGTGFSHRPFACIKPLRWRLISPATGKGPWSSPLSSPPNA